MWLVYHKNSVQTPHRHLVIAQGSSLTTSSTLLCHSLCFSSIHLSVFQSYQALSLLRLLPLAVSFFHRLSKWALCTHYLSQLWCQPLRTAFTDQLLQPHSGHSLSLYTILSPSWVMFAYIFIFGQPSLEFNILKGILFTDLFPVSTVFDT